MFDPHGLNTIDSELSLKEAWDLYLHKSQWCCKANIVGCLFVGSWEELKQKITKVFHLLLNIFYCSIGNNWIGHKFHKWETSSPIHTWINTKWTYITLYTYFILSEDKFFTFRPQ